jgi:FAD/FMN-containing dehydrogenase
VANHWLVKRRRVGASTLMLSTPDPIRHYETEAVVPLSAGGEAFDRTVSLIERLRLRVNFILELRYVRGDSAWMSPAYGGDAVSLGACTFIARGRRAYFDAYWQEMRPLGGRPHWAKEMDHDGPEIRSLYPMADRFLEQRDKLDPERVFSNHFLDRILGP